MEASELQLQTDTKLKRIAWLSERDPQKEFNNLMHLFNEESLKECFNELDGRKAVGADGVNKASYEENLDDNLQKLIEQMTRMAYRPDQYAKYIFLRTVNQAQLDRWVSVIWKIKSCRR